MRQSIVKDLRSKTKGQGQGLDVQGQGQGQGKGLHKVSSRRLEAKAMASRTSSLLSQPPTRHKNIIKHKSILCTLATMYQYGL